MVHSKVNDISVQQHDNSENKNKILENDINLNKLIPDPYEIDKDDVVTNNLFSINDKFLIEKKWDKTMNMDNTLCIKYWNIDGLHKPEKNMSRFKLDDTYILEKFDNTDIMILPESHWTENDINTLQGWQMFNSPRTVGGIAQQSGGVVVFVNSKISKFIDHKKILYQEGICCIPFLDELKCPNTKKPYCLIGIYIPPEQSKCWEMHKIDKKWDVFNNLASVLTKY